MGLISNILDFAADKVQSVTGEKERRELVATTKNFAAGFKRNVKQAIQKINTHIQCFNEQIQKINSTRKMRVQSNILSLSNFLSKFGSLDSTNQYIDESTKNVAEIPERIFESTSQYINDIDWSKQDVFTDTLFLTPIGMTIKTQNQNLSMREQLDIMKIEAKSTLQQLKIIEDTAKQDCEIAKIYGDCIIIISDYIEKFILPELEVVEAFLQAITLKNKIIAGKDLKNISFDNNLQVLLLGPYETHYHFIKNTFAFYLISITIFNTPILTKLIENNTTEYDLMELKNHQQLLIDQKNNVTSTAMFVRSNTHGQ